MDKTFRGAPDEYEGAPTASSAAPHPEEMGAKFKMRIGTWFSMRATMRTTPAGLVSAAVLAAVILVPIVLLVKSRRRA